MRCEVIGHRANTKKWIKRYIKDGAHGIEIDIYLKGDHVNVGHPIDNTKPALLREKVSKILLGTHLNKGINIIEAIRYVKGRILWLDLKDPNIYEKVLDIEDLKNEPSKVIVTTRFHDEVPNIKRKYPWVEALLSMESLPPRIESVIEEAMADGISLKYEIAEKRPEVIRRLVNENVKIGLWIINDKEQIKNAVNWGVKYVVTDFASLALKYCKLNQ